jgi:glycosyltransferase involved in cell wall biosynthesis
MQLLYVLPEFPPDVGGGIATVYGRLLPRLAALGHHVTVLLASRERLNKAAYRWQGVEVVPLQVSYLAQAEKELKGWRHHAFLHQFLPLAWAAWHQARGLAAFDVVEVTDWALLFLPWLVQQRRQPLLVSLHGSCGQVDWYGNPGARGGEGQLVRLLETAALPLADGVIANSTLNAGFWQHECGVQAQVIPPIADQQAPSPAGHERSQRGVVVGRLQNWKGPEVLCEALRLVPNQQLDWIGQDTPWQEGPLSSSAHLRQAFPDVVDHQLHFLGPRPPDQVRAAIQQAAFVCIPSLWDVFNVTVLDSLTLGTPVICSNRAGASMLLEHESSAYLFDVDRPSELADCMTALNGLGADDLIQIKMNASHSAARTCDPFIVVEQYTNLIDRLSTCAYSTVSPAWLRSTLEGGTHHVQQTRHNHSLITLVRRLHRARRK